MNAKPINLFYLELAYPTRKFKKVNEIIEKVTICLQ